jgi:two-component system, sensor histidine kinase and response regulator
MPRKTAARHSLPSELIHELRTPLSQIIGYTEMIMEQAEDTGHAAFTPDLLKVRAAGYHLLGLINYNFHPVRPGDMPEGRASVIKKARDDRAHAEEVPAGDDAPASSEYPATPGATTDTGFILVVDDNEMNRDVLSRRLKGRGYSVATANDGVRALEMLQTQAFDLVLLDIMMPEMDGYEVLTRLKADEQLRNIPVIMISAIDEVDSVVRCIELGADDYLMKPFNPTLLKARIGSSLEKKAARDREVVLFEQLARNYTRLQELEQLRDDLTNMIVHDLRTPLTAVIAGMQMVGVLGDVNSEQQKMMQLAIGGGETLLDMINDLLDVEKMESGTMELECTNVSVAALIGSAILQVGILADRKKQTLLRDVPSSLRPILCDENKVRRTLVNLLANAIKFTPVGGKVVIEARQQPGDGATEFAVTDNGEGIPQAAFDRIFDKFGQVESRQGGQHMSTGLGLTFCRLAVEAHGGRIAVESELGNGSTFRFDIPATAA